MSEYYPETMRALPRFEGPFDAFKLTAEDCDVLFASYLAGAVIDSHSHETENIGVITKGGLFLQWMGRQKELLREAGITSELMKSMQPSLRLRHPKSNFGLM